MPHFQDIAHAMIATAPIRAFLSLGLDPANFLNFLKSKLQSALICIFEMCETHDWRCVRGILNAAARVSDHTRETTRRAWPPTIDRQREVVNNLKLAGLETKINEDVLRLFERQQAKFQDHYDGLMRGG